MEWIKMPDLPGAENTLSLGVSAPFVGIINKKLIVAGGCNFPDKPVTEGGTKRYYDEVFLLDLANTESKEWKLIGKLPAPMAYGAAVSIPEGIVCIGGNNAESFFKDVYLLSYNDISDEMAISSLPSLPYPMDNFSAATDGHHIYVAGGNGDGQPSNSFFRLDINQKQKGWETLIPFPGAMRVQPVLIAQQGKDEMMLYLAGGFQPITERKAAVVPTEVLSYSPSKGEWKQESTLPSFSDGTNRTLTGGGGVAYLDNSILFAGGVNYECFLAAIDRPRQIEQAQREGNNYLVDSLQMEAKEYMHHPVEWYNFNTTLLLYNTLTKEWEELGDYEQLARAGAGMIIHNNELIIINGELKPGIRTPEVNALKLPYNL